jgi:hypothetical protein
MQIRIFVLHRGGAVNRCNGRWERGAPRDGVVMLVVRNTVWLSICRIAADLSGLVLFTVISRRYGPR